MIAGPHGVRGLVRLRSFTENPESIVDYEPLTDEMGKKSFEVTFKSAAKDFFIASVKGVNSREEAEALQGTKLYVSRASMPKTGKREYYEADLIGLVAKDKAGKDYGTVRGVHNYGAGVFLEMGCTKADTIMVPFNDVCVPNVDIKGGCITIDPPEGLIEAKGEKKESKGRKGAQNA